MNISSTALQNFNLILAILESSNMHIMVKCSGMGHQTLNLKQYPATNEWSSLQTLRLRTSAGETMTKLMTQDGDGPN